MIALILAVVAAAQDVEAPAFSAGNDELRAYVMEAAEQNPALQAAYSDWRAAMERIPQVTALDDPMFTYGQFLQSDVSRFKVGLAQKFPWFGTLRLQGDRYAAAADAQLAHFYHQRNRLIAEVKRAYFEYAYIHDQVGVLSSQHELHKFMEETARTRYALGLAPEDDLLDAQIRLTQHGDLITQIDDLRPALSAQLTKALGRPSGELLPWPQDVAAPSDPPPAPVIAARIRAVNPELDAFDHDIEGWRLQGELAAKKGRPDFTVGLEYTSLSKPRQVRPDRPYPASLNGGRRIFQTLSGQRALDPVQMGFDSYAVALADEPFAYSDGGDDNIMLSVKLSVPIWRKRIRAGIAEAEYQGDAAMFKKEDRAQALDAAARMALFAYTDAKRRQTLYASTLVPQARQAFESLQSAYAADLPHAQLPTVLDALDKALTFELEGLRATRDQQIAAADLEFLIGGPWTGE
jgi:outer membrane protein TolC